MKKPCHCYVRALSIEEQFTLRYGAHETWCGMYRQSLDPVDKKMDIAIRIAFMQQFHDLHNRRN